MTEGNSNRRSWWRNVLSLPEGQNAMNREEQNSGSDDEPIDTPQDSDFGDISHPQADAQQSSTAPASTYLPELTMPPSVYLSMNISHTPHETAQARQRTQADAAVAHPSASVVAARPGSVAGSTIPIPPGLPLGFPDLPAGVGDRPLTGPAVLDNIEFYTRIQTEPGETAEGEDDTYYPSTIHFHIGDDPCKKWEFDIASACIHGGKVPLTEWEKSQGKDPDAEYAKDALYLTKPADIDRLIEAFGLHDRRKRDNGPEIRSTRRHDCERRGVLVSFFENCPAVLAHVAPRTVKRDDPTATSGAQKDANVAQGGEDAQNWHLLEATAWELGRTISKVRQYVQSQGLLPWPPSRLGEDKDFISPPFVLSKEEDLIVGEPKPEIELFPKDVKITPSTMAGEPKPETTMRLRKRTTFPLRRMTATTADTAPSEPLPKFEPFPGIDRRQVFAEGSLLVEIDIYKKKSNYVGVRIGGVFVLSGEKFVFDRLSSKQNTRAESMRRARREFQLSILQRPRWQRTCAQFVESLEEYD